MEKEIIFTTCLNCGNQCNVKKTDIQKDEMGNFTTCSKCGATFDIK